MSGQKPPPNNNGKKETMFGHAAKPYNKPKIGPDPNVPFENWEWKTYDTEFYNRFHKLPDSKDPQMRHQVKWNRFNQA
jgi:hypothetical protein